MRNHSYVLALLAGLAAPVFAQEDFAVPPAPHIEDYFEPGIAPVRADPRADVTVIYFMDYQCPACRTHSPDVSAVFGSDRKLKVIYRDTPIFGPLSVEAAKYAIASQYQGKHEAFHRALMAQKLPLDAAAVKAAAVRAGIDWSRLERDRAAHEKAIDAQIAQNQNLSEAAGVSGTPAFIIGNTLANGALDAAGLRAEIADARAASTKSAPDEEPTQENSELPTEEKADAPSDGAGSASASVALATSPAPAAAPSFAQAQATQPDKTTAKRLWIVPAAIAILLAGLAALSFWFRRRTTVR